ncbi:MAG: protein kinase, partial [Roseiflexus castenholzii]
MSCALNQHRRQTMATLRAQPHSGNNDSPGSAPPTGAAREVRNYRLDQRLGQDELAVIYRATHLTLDRPVLVSVLHRTDWISSSRFQLAARLAAHLTHPNLLPVIDAGHDDRIGHYLVTPYLDTRSLHDVLANGALDPVEALRIATQLASVLDYLHAQNVVHRDVQPANILVTPQGTVYLTNLSLAASPDTPDLSSIDDTDYRTPYTAPEQTLRTGQPAPAGDLY